MVAADLIRESKMTNLLSNLSGSKREQMEILLKGVATERLEETYKQFVGRIMKDEPQVQISESSQQTTVKTGDAVVITESQSKSAVDDDFRKELQRLAGITK
jgi:ribosomal protein S17